jgi:hypothetical protein
VHAFGVRVFVCPPLPFHTTVGRQT